MIGSDVRNRRSRSIYEVAMSAFGPKAKLREVRFGAAVGG